VIAALREEGAAITLFWYNPNIHPFTEYQSRRDTLAAYAKTLELPLEMDDYYGLRLFVAECYGGAASPLKKKRCAACYRLRMERCAAEAKAGGFDGFSTTLLVSPWQDHEGLRAAAEGAAAVHGTAFFYRDFRPHFRQGQAAARALGLYRQKYCGCIFSEEERYAASRQA
jgi:predicted adenine nucleotide alpha hydrolase (AANH) superfamily ATPase